MKCRILKPLKANGEKELFPGDIVDVPKDLAIKYIQKGKIKPVEKKSYRIYSNILEDYLWIAETDNDLHYLRERGIQEPIYTIEECKKLKGSDKEHLKAVHEVKETFPQSKVKEIKRNAE